MFICNTRFIVYIVGSRGASQLGGSLLGIPPGYKANKLIVSLSYPLGIIRTLVRRLAINFGVNMLKHNVPSYLTLTFTNRESSIST